MKLTIEQIEQMVQETMKRWQVQKRYRGHAEPEDIERDEAEGMHNIDSLERAQDIAQKKQDIEYAIDAKRRKGVKIKKKPLTKKQRQRKATEKDQMKLPFINEQEQMKALKKVISQGNIPERYALSLGKYKGGYSLVLYQLPPLKPEVAGFCQIFKTEKPCIPETYEVGAMVRKAGRDYKGLGAIMYDLAASVVKRQHNGGITSDHSSSTTEAAYKVWNKMLNSGNYIKRGTAISGGKHDKFDYDNSTPSDPADDCDIPKGSDVAASDHSLQIKQESPYLEKFLSNHKNALDIAAKAAEALGQPFDAAEIESALEDEGVALFSERYDGTIPVLKKQYFSIWNTIKRAIGMKE